MTREEFCNRIEVKCFECGEMCDKYNNAECVEDLCKKNLVAEFEAKIRKDERNKTINYIWMRVNQIRFKHCWNGADFPYSEFIKILDEMKGEMRND